MFLKLKVFLNYKRKRLLTIEEGVSSEHFMDIYNQYVYVLLKRRVLCLKNVLDYQFLVHLSLLS